MRSFYNPVRIYFADNYLNATNNIVAKRKTLLITSSGWRKRGLIDNISKVLGEYLIDVFDNVTPNPTLDSIIKLSNNCRKYTQAILLAVGGGSVIDATKALSACLSIEDQTWLKRHFREEVPFPEGFRPLPVIAIPTTAGTGSEVTQWATIWDMELKQKESLSHLRLYPEIAILNPELTMSAPKDVMIYSALDALSHSFEAIWNKNANPVSDVLATEGIKIILTVLPKVVSSPTDAENRALLQKGSLLAGLAFSNTQTALAHAISYPLTLHYGMPHGLACSFTLPAILRWNNNTDPERFRILAHNLGRDSSNDLADELENLLQVKGILDAVQAYLTQGPNLDTIKSELVTPSRAGNNIKPTSSDDALKLIRYSLKTSTVTTQFDQ